MFRSGSLKLYTPLSLIVAITVSLPLYRQWEAALFYLFGPNVATLDPMFSKPVSYYLFSLPIYLILQHRLLIAVSILFLAILFLYWLEHRMLSGENRHLPRGARTHLSILIFTIVAIQVWGYILQRHELVYTAAHEPFFFGPGFVEMWIILPLIWICMLLFAALAFSSAYFIHYRKGLKTTIVIAVAFLAATGLRYSSYLPKMTEKYIVKPNEIIREKPYITANIVSTLAGYKLDQVKIKPFHTEPIPWRVTPNVKEIIHNIPVWEKEILDQVYEQLQAIRPYYDFRGIDVDRYRVGKVYQQVYLSAREMSTAKLPDYAKSWVNRHLQYTHGNGLVMTPAAQGGNQFMTWFIQDIPPRSRYGFTIKEPKIYYGTESYPFVIAPNTVGEFDYPKGPTNVLTNYSGTGGVPVSSLFQRFLLAVYFKDKNIFFTTKSTDRSRLLFRRNILERIAALTPFVKLDDDPYIVITSKKLYWIEDGFTTSRWYPDSEYTREKGRKYNYIRDALKIIVDAYTGRVTYFVSDPSDPIIRAYQRMYPGLFQPLDKMPPELRKHIRYPRDIFHTQMNIYSKYHQTDPELFYRQEDIWSFSRTYRHEKPFEIKPYYLTLNLFRPDKSEFLLLIPMSPKSRDNSRALAIARCDGKNYGKLVVYSFPTEEQVYGPAQIDALIDQNTSIAKQFTLWDQIGSEVIRGRMILLPVGQVILYIEPMYLRSSTRSPIPELKRLIVSQGAAVAMDVTLASALKKLERTLKSKNRETLEQFPVPKIVKPGKAPPITPKGRQAVPAPKPKTSSK